MDVNLTRAAPTNNKPPRSDRDPQPEFIRRAVELRDIDVLMAVTEAGSFRRAAAALRLEPSAVSRRVRRMEDLLGVSLFERNGSGVRLTNAGKLFHEEASNAVSLLDGAVRLAMAAGRGSKGVVAVGLIGSLSSEFLWRLITAFRSDHPDVVITICEGSLHNHLVAIASGALDVAFVLGAPRLEAVKSLHLWSEPIYAAVSTKDIRSTDISLSFETLVDDRFIVSYDAPGPEVHDLIIRQFSDAGFQPQVDKYKVGREGLMLMVGMRFGLSLVCASETRISYPEVSYVPVAGQEIGHSAIWSDQNDNPALRRLLSRARQLSEQATSFGVS